MLHWRWRTQAQSQGRALGVAGQLAKCRGRLKRAGAQWPLSAPAPPSPPGCPSLTDSSFWASRALFHTRKPLCRQGCGLRAVLARSQGRPPW
eukprot:363767-Chlamydomonas_euryale.AAC.2